MMKIQQLLDAGVHLGHQAKRWNPKMLPYLYTQRMGIHIIDLVQTAHLLNQACEILTAQVSEGKRILFVGTKPQASIVVEEQATRCGEFFIHQRWLGGLLTNWTTVQSRLQRWRQLLEAKFDHLTKKEASALKRELNQLNRQMRGIQHMDQLPNLVIVVDPNKENTAVLECRKLGIFTIGLVDTNADPEAVDLAIPANDDAIASIQLILSCLADAILKAKKL
uniref:Small ribosomal subunit protein uS2c n=1 Tax=Cyanidiococcus yangmingshanensis TaxID=2690220 RepID=A0A7G5VUR1_9RHOD|nr:30S ribosomal protein S2 [Cyanidiococcus yangmingshanensis]QMX77428.1 30S ribosomal protein S2 [Cyanidiococcus yangmingshanensis]UNJ16042.1 ribosomal protein S2 [Cyanidioschyzonaceae sp. 3]WDB00465.1 ribosomal protein S2 [Cyanidiococcus yangmingshanensis]